MLGAISAFIATLAFSINAPLAYAAFKRGVSSQTLVAIRNVIAFIILLPLADFKISLSTLLVVMLSALLGPGLGDYAYFKAIAQSGVATAVTIGYTYIFTTQIFATALGVEHPRALTIIGALLAFIGIYIALGGRPRGLGVLYGVLASISWGAASAALGAASKDASPFTIAVIRSAVLAPLFSLFSNFSEAKKGRDYIRRFIRRRRLGAWIDGFYICHVANRRSRYCNSHFSNAYFIPAIGQSR